MPGEEAMARFGLKVARAILGAISRRRENGEPPVLGKRRITDVGDEAWGRRAELVAEVLQEVVDEGGGEDAIHVRERSLVSLACSYIESQGGRYGKGEVLSLGTDASKAALACVLGLYTREEDPTDPQDAADPGPANPAATG